MECRADSDRPANGDAGLRRRQTISHCPPPWRASLIPRVVVAVLCSLWTVQGIAQELTPRAYWPSPKGTKVAVFGYSHVEGDVLFDPSIPLYGVDSNIRTGILAYLQTFSLAGRTTNVVVELPYSWGTTKGLVGEEPGRRDFSAFNDLGLTLSVNLLGAPTMTPPEFQALRADPHLILGATLKIHAPTGQYRQQALERKHTDWYEDKNTDQQQCRVVCRVDWLALWTKALDAGRQVRADSGDVTYAPPGKVNHMRA